VPPKGPRRRTAIAGRDGGGLRKEGVNRAPSHIRDAHMQSSVGQAGGWTHRLSLWQRRTEAAPDGRINVTVELSINTALA